MTAIAELTLADLRRFATQLPTHDDIPAAKQIRTTVNTVLDASAYTDADKLTDLDLRDLFDMLASAKPHLARNTIDTYRRHVRRAVRMLVDHTAGRPDWWAARQPHSPKRRKSTTTSPTRSAAVKRPTAAFPSTAAAAPAASLPAHATPSALITHRFPVRAGLTAVLELPADMSRGEADRLAQFVAALVL